MATGSMRRDLGKQRYWRQVIGRWQRSGQTVSGFCRQAKLSQASFHWWRRELRRRNGEGRKGGEGHSTPRRSRKPSSGHGGQRSSKRRAPQATASFMPVPLLADSTDDPGLDPGALEITLRSGHRIRLREPIDVSRLAQVIDLLEGQAGC